MVLAAPNKLSLTICLLLLTSTLSLNIVIEDIQILYEEYISRHIFSKIPPQASQPFPQYVSNLNYPVETHTVTTSDGYINTYFRIQAKGTTIKSGLPVVYLQHGLLDSSDTWIVNSEDQAPGFLVANAGFDVWIGNTRGNTYSQGHVTYNASNSSSPYWDFSWQEMSQYDLPAAFQYIHDFTGQQIIYAGHSQGTSIMFAALARQDPVVLKYLKHYIALAPVVYVDHVLSPEVDIIEKTNLGLILEKFDMKKFLFIPGPVKTAMELLCEYADAACIAQLRMISDTHPELDSTDRMDVILGHFPAGTSTQNGIYWNQMLLDKSFAMYNYGKAGNLEHYGQDTPPLYDLSKINVPVYMFAGIYDELAYTNSTQTVRDQLTGSPKVFYQEYPLGHASFVWGKYVTAYFDDVLTVMKS